MNITKHIESFKAIDDNGNVVTLDVYQDFIVCGCDIMSGLKRVREGSNHVNILDGDKRSEFLVVETNTHLTRLTNDS